MTKIKIGNVMLGDNEPCFTIAEAGANHDGSLARAKKLIRLCAKAGANAAKFQHFKAETIVSDFGFKALGNNKSHQALWKKSVYDTYNDASLNSEWTSELKETCDQVGITFFTSPAIFILRENIVSNRKRIYDNYAGMFPSFEVFCQVMDQCTENYECLVINNNAKSNKLSDQVFWYKAEARPDFRIGGPAFWEYSDKNYTSQKEGEEDYSGKKKNQVNVNKLLY